MSKRELLAFVHELAALSVINQISSDEDLIEAIGSLMLDEEED